ncbi:MAG: NAD+ synthase [Deltaproteobacteria bacterium]|nr:NAD+ synthase [Deltaproteobacteria bacterium]
MKIGIAQINTTVGDFAGNTEKIVRELKWAESQGADLVVFPELTVCGYPPRDLLERSDFLHANLTAVEKIASQTQTTGVVIGYTSQNQAASGRGLFNTAGLLAGGKIQLEQHKTLLPEYDVFDEARHFEPASRYHVVTHAGINIGLSLCEDLWSAHRFGGRQYYQRDPLQELSRCGADVLINLSASPYSQGKPSIRASLLADAAKRHHLPVIYCNLVGGNDELVFDGASFVVDAEGRVVHQLKSFTEDHGLVDLESLVPLQTSSQPSDIQGIREALVLGLRDYSRKCGFREAIVGLSGGIDSAVVAALAVRALGEERVTGILMPSPFTQPQSVQDAQELAQRLGIRTEVHSMTDIYASYRDVLGFRGKVDEVSLAEENLQARIRGNILMTLSNQRGAMVLSTGNKSELAVGYCTLYGDMVGGLSVISDVPKTMVYDLARELNREREVIPASIMARPPTAELKPNQKDQDLLPDYAVLDGILKAYIEELRSPADIVKRGFDAKVVADVVRRVDCNEYKRRQAAPGLKVTSKAFGIGRRFPIAWKPLHEME